MSAVRTKHNRSPSPQAKFRRTKTAQKRSVIIESPEKSNRKRGKPPKNNKEEVLTTPTKSTKSKPSKSISTSESGKRGRGRPRRIVDSDDSYKNSGRKPEYDIKVQLKARSGKKSTKKRATDRKPEPVRYPADKLHGVLEKFDHAILNLQEYTLPDEIPCRETEKEAVREFIMEGLENNGLSHCLCKFWPRKLFLISLLDISGVPGIGKTVSVLEVIKQILKEQKNKKVRALKSNEYMYHAK